MTKKQNSSRQAIDEAAYAQKVPSRRGLDPKTRLLSQASVELLGLASEEEVYLFLAERLREILGEDALVSTSSYEAETRLMRMRALAGTPEKKGFVKSFLGEEPVGVAMYLDEYAERQLLTGILHEIPKGVRDLTPELSESDSEEVEQALALGDLHAMGIVWGGRLIGNTILLLGKGREMPDGPYAEALVRLAAVVLQRLMAERETRQAALRWKQTFDAVGDLVFIVDENYRVERVNQAMADYLGMEPDDCRGRVCYELIHQTKAPPDFCPHGKVQARHREQNLQFLDDRQGRTISGKVSPILNESGTRAGTVHVLRDITAEQLAEQTLQAIMSSPEDAIFVIDKDGICLEVNQALADRFGVEKKDFSGKSIYKYLPRELAETRKRVTDSIFRSGKGIRYEDQRDEGWYDHSIFPIKDASGEVVRLVFISRDITRLKQKERELSDVNAALRVLVRQVEEEKMEQEKRLRRFLDSLVVPYLDKLGEQRLSREAKTYTDIVRSHLGRISGSLAQNYSELLRALTPTEKQVADMVMGGRSSKEIAGLLHVSEHAVAFHRKNIRKKLGLTSRKGNLQSHLQSLASGRS